MSAKGQTATLDLVSRARQVGRPRCETVQSGSPRASRYEKSQIITAANGRPTPNDQPRINISAKSKPIPARNWCNDMPLLL
jgi:hypothetical protein